jgi:hypothetical protein
MASNELLSLLLVIVILSLLSVIIFCWCYKRARRGNHYDPIYNQPSPETTITIPGDILTTSTNLANECAICLEMFDAGEQMRVLNCGHYYHKQCVDGWLKDGKSCPKCRGKNII